MEQQSIFKHIFPSFVNKSTNQQPNTQSKEYLQPDLTYFTFLTIFIYQGHYYIIYSRPALKIHQHVLI